VLTDNRHGRVAGVQTNASDGKAEREVAAKTLIAVAAPGKRVTVGADKASDTFVEAYRDVKVLPHVAQNTKRIGGRSTSF
jgi:hypothetical protein